MITKTRKEESTKGTNMMVDPHFKKNSSEFREMGKQRKKELSN